MDHMKIIVTHSMPDMDAITSAWIIKRFLPGWEEAEIKFVFAGDKYRDKVPVEDNDFANAIEKYGKDEVIHVDTGMGPLDHHQVSDDMVCGATRSLDFVELVKKNSKLKDEKLEAVKRMVGVVVDDDHFKEVFRPDPLADYHDFSIVTVLEGLKLQKPNEDMFYLEYVFQALDALLHAFENRIWAEEEIKKGQEFKVEQGKALAMDSINDSAIKLAQIMDYVLVIRRDPRKGYVRIKATPNSDIDLTHAYEQLKKMDPDATWFLHVSRKMLLNGTSKNPKMKPTKLKLDAIISVLKK